MAKQDFNIVAEDYTVYLMVGPSNCGKSTLAKQLQMQLAFQSVDSRVLSSDDIRRDLLGDIEINKYDPRMLEVSSQAFDLLYSRLRAYTSHPVNVPFIFVDSTGLSEQFRKDIISIAECNSYKVVCILFTYDERQDWFKYEGGNKFVTNKHVDKMQKHVYKEIKAKDYHKIIRVTAPIESVQLTYVSNKENLLVEGKDYTVIGDVHGCLDELKDLLSTVTNTPILVGDWIDYKPEVSIEEATKYNMAIIDFLIDNPQILLIKGNHEENLFNNVDKPYKENKYFTSRYLISTSEEYKNKFIELYNRSYVSIRGEGFIVTHAPCKAKYLLKNRDKQINLYYTSENKCTIINDIYSSTNYNSCWPTHLFGHLTFNKPINNKFCIGLDTGVGYGNYLTGYDLSTNKTKVVASKLDSKYVVLDNVTKFVPVEKDLNLSLDDEEARRLAAFIRNKTPYISGTMCPANKTDFVLEDVSTALAYFKGTGQKQVLIQPKYMGSRAQVLLYRNDAESQYEVFTRNGFKLRHTEELDQAISQLRNSICSNDRFYNLIEWNGEGHSVLLDCELMPWSYLGKGLISNEFTSYLEANKTHIEYFKKYDVYADLIEAKNKDNEYLKSWTYINTQDELKLFESELAKYANIEDPYFVPFNILKIESTDKVLYSNSDFAKYNNEQLLSMLPCPLFKMDVDDLNTVKDVMSLYKDIEGIVIKPLINYEHQAPYIKVRNEDYLRLVYGHDYTIKLDKWIEKKHISRKLSVSIKEWHLGNRLLDIHSSMFTEDNKEYTNTLISLMFELKRESTLDPRL